jgi:hypothetical protein
MRRLAALLCFLLLAWAVPAAAQTEIHRCIGANGGAVFTDQPCAALQATPVTAATPTHDIPLVAPLPILCAASLDELRQSVIDAFANRDANRMAGLMLWDGYGRGGAIADIRSLSQWMKQPLLDVEVPGAPAADGDDSTLPAAAGGSVEPFATEVPPHPASASDQLVLHTAGNDGSGSPRDLRFRIVRQAGCLWLRYAE